MQLKDQYLFPIIWNNLRRECISGVMSWAIWIEMAQRKLSCFWDMEGDAFDGYL